MQKKGLVQIVLQSDLCVASGYSYDGVIDTDICYDELGIPYIPAKRLKGCFRETAESILYGVISDDDRDKIFGKWGEQFANGIKLGNAYIQNYIKIKEELNPLIENKDYEGIINPQKILDQFTHVQAQTAIGYRDDEQKSNITYDGAAKDNSLRYTRVVNQYSPISGESIIFESEILYNSDYEEKIKMILKGTRNIGLKRNRGLGSVKCYLKDTEEVGTVATTSISDDNDKIWLDYELTNLEPLVMSDKDDQKTMDYIKGQTIIGAVASKYLAIEGHSADDEVFKDLFLNGNTIFTNAMPSKKGKTYFPAPLFINELKKSKEIVNGICVDTEKINNGNLPKKLKGKYMYASPDFKEVDILEVDKQICYHHSHKSKKKENEKDILFAFEVIRENQLFNGSIIISRKYEKLIKDLMTSDTISIGKSKSSQYGSCQVKFVDLLHSTERKFSKGDVIAVTLLSDMILYNGVDYTVCYDEVRAMLAKELGIKYDKNFSDCSIISTKEVTGYLSVWNMRKTPVPAIAAGSMFAYELTEDIQVSEEFCGERCLEGFGRIRVDNLDTRKDEINKIENEDEKTNISIALTKSLLSRIFIHDLEMEIVLKGIDDKKFDLTSSKIGRVTLMLKESLDENREDYYKAFKAFKNRVASIKSEEERKNIERTIVKKIFKNDKELDVDVKDISLWNKMEELGFSEKERNEMLNSLWGRYVLTVLINQKYENKNSGDVSCKQKKKIL